MATRNDDHCPITLLAESDQQHFRLLELPAELLALLTSDDAPTLQLKSRENTTGDPKDASLVLCTPDKTYSIRQVNTSNSLWITRPCETKTNGEEGMLPVGGLEAFAKIESTLELLPPTKQSAVPFIKAALPVFASTSKATAQKCLSRNELFSRIPTDQAECEEAFRAMACFESEDSSSCFVPSVQVKAQILQSITGLATAANIDLTAASFLPGVVPDFAIDLTEDWPFELVVAILASISTPNADGNLVIDKASFVRHIGLSTLQARCEGRSTETKPFLKAWQEAMPEKWRTACTVSGLAGSATTQEGGSIISYVEGSNAVYDAAGPITTDSKAASLGAKRKWHEKFRASKK